MAQPKSASTIQAVLEAMNLLGEGGLHWLGGQQSLQGGDNIIMSRNYPSNYPNNYDEVNIVDSSSSKHIFTIFVQEWQLQVPNGFIQLVFVSFDIEEYDSRLTDCVYDWVEVYYGSYSEKFCGSSIPGPFTSTGPTMRVKMHTDGSVTRTGFRALWGDLSNLFLWFGDNSMVDSSNWAQGFPVSG